MFECLRERGAEKSVCIGGGSSSGGGARERARGRGRRRSKLEERERERAPPPARPESTQSVSRPARLNAKTMSAAERDAGGAATARAKV